MKSYDEMQRLCNNNNNFKQWHNKMDKKNPQVSIDGYKRSQVKKKVK